MEFTDNHIEQYVLGTLSPELSVLFNQALESNDELVERLAAYTLGEYNKIKLKNKLSKIAVEVKRERKKKFKYMLVATMLAIVSIPTIIGIIENPFNYHLFTSHYEPVEQIPTINHGNDHPHTKGFVSYQNGDYLQALNYFNQNDSKEDHIHFYEGLSYLSISKDDNNALKAIKSFKKIEEKSEYKGDALWYKSLSYLLLDKVEQAKSVLKRLVNKDHAKSNKARNLLKKLE